MEIQTVDQQRDQDENTETVDGNFLLISDERSAIPLINKDKTAAVTTNEQVPRDINDEKMRQAIRNIKTELSTTISTPDLLEISDKLTSEKILGSSFIPDETTQSAELLIQETENIEDKNHRNSTALIVSKEVWTDESFQSNQPDKASRKSDTSLESSSSNSSMTIERKPRKKKGNSSSKLKQSLISSSIDLTSDGSETNEHSEIEYREKDVESTEMKLTAPLDTAQVTLLSQSQTLNPEISSRKSKSLTQLALALDSMPTHETMIRKLKDSSDMLDSLIQNKKSTSKLPTFSYTAADSSDIDREHAALTIQRCWRYHRLRCHFSMILGQVHSQKSKESQVDISRTRRRSVLMWMIAREFSKSNEQLSRKPSIRPKIKVEEKVDSSEHLVSLESLNEPLSESEEAIDTDVTKKKIIARYINEFNKEANKGMKNLISHGCVSGDPESIAQFLLKEPRLSKTKIGEYLGAGDDIHNKTLTIFISLIDFTGLEFDAALRELLKTFRLPGEAQKIDRVMNEFARRYCLNNPGIFSNADTAYILAYSLIMLNTDAHNPNVKKKMSLQDFLRNNRGIDNKQNLPEEFMKKLYFNIVNHEIKMNEFDNVYKISEICNQIAGKFENIVESHRRFIREFTFQQIPDYSRPNTHRHDRILFLFNDLMLVTKPKTPPLSSGHSFNAGTESSFGTSTLTGTISSMKSEQGKYFFRYLFNMISLNIIDRDNNQWHENVVDLVNSTGRLMCMSFPSPEEKLTFMGELSEYIEEVWDMEEEKLQKLRNLTGTKSSAAKILIEETYSFNDEGAMNRFAKYESLRLARNIMTCQARLLMGKRKAAGPQKEIYPEVKVIEPLLSEFSHKIMLGKPSASPEEQTKQQSSAAITSDTVEEGDETQDQKSPLESPTDQAESSESPSTLFGIVAANKLRKRRNTYSSSATGQGNLHSSVNASSITTTNQ